MPRLTLLGGAALEDEDGVVTGPAAQNRPLALLALLAVAPSRSLARSKIAGFLWPETDETTARERLSSCVHRARTALGKEGLVSARDELRLNESVLDCDVWDFEQALEEGDPRRAVDLYGGAFLDGFRLEGSPVFEKQVDQERGRLSRGYRRALEALAEEAEELGESAEAADWWRKRANEDPYDSRVVRRLMDALLAAGNPAGALRAAEVHERLMREELDVAPDPAVSDLAGELRAGNTSEKGPGTGTSTAGANMAPTSMEPARTSGVSDPFTESPAEDPMRSTAVRVAAAILLLAAVGAGGWLLTGGAEIDGGAIDDRSVAVLPFEGAGGDQSVEISQGIYDGVLTDMANVSGLRVTSPYSASQFADTAISVSEIARELGVRWIVAGRVHQADERIRVHARLIDARDDETRLAREYERDLTTDGLFSIEGNLAKSIARSLRAELTVGERERIDRSPTADLEAYRYYSRGRGLLVQRTNSSMARSEVLFRRAVERDSTFASAWAALAKSLVLYPEARNRDPDQVFPRGIEAAERALELDPELPEAHMALAVVHFYRMRVPAALERLERTIELEPSYPMAHHALNLAYLVMGRPEEALRYAQRAVALSPLSPENQIGLALASIAVGDHERALRAARRVQEIEPDYLSGGAYLEGYALYRLGELTRNDTTVPEGVRRQLLALEEATSGNPDPARQLLARYEERFEGPAFAVGLLHAALGREAEALGTFEAVFRRQETSGGGVTIRLRYQYPDVLGPLREKPRWKELVREINTGWGLDPNGTIPEAVDGSPGEARASRLGQ